MNTAGRITFHEALNAGVEAVCMSTAKSDYRPESKALRELIDILNRVEDKECLGCGGTGQISPIGRCTTCNGTGKMQDQ